MGNRILIASNDIQIASMIQEAFENDGVKVEICLKTSAEEAYSAYKEDFALVIFDLRLINKTGMALLQQFQRKETGSLEDLDTNASTGMLLPPQSQPNQFWSDPVDAEDVVAFAKAALRKQASADGTDIIKIGKELELSEATKTAYWKGSPLELQPKQFDILSCLAKNIGHVVSKEQIYRVVWKDDYDVNCDAMLKRHMNRIREVFKQNGVNIKLQTYWRRGYGVILD